MKTPKLSELVSAGKNGNHGGTAVQAIEKELAREDQKFTTEALREAWSEFAEQRKMYLAEYQLLTQPYDRRDNEIVVHLHNPIQEAILNTIKADLIAFLRNTLQNKSIALTGEMREIESKKILYTNREKFEFLLEKYPGLKELRDRLGLDTDF